jgi:hypothetical protein
LLIRLTSEAPHHLCPIAYEQLRCTAFCQPPAPTIVFVDTVAVANYAGE